MILCSPAYLTLHWKTKIFLKFPSSCKCLEVLPFILLIYPLGSYALLHALIFFFLDDPLSHLLKQLVTMEVIQWTQLWEAYKDDFEKEANLLGGSLGPKAADDLRQRIIEHVCILILSSLPVRLLCLQILFSSIYKSPYFAEYIGGVQILCEDYLKETCWSFVPHITGLLQFSFLWYNQSETSFLFSLFFSFSCIFQVSLSVDIFSFHFGAYIS